MMAGMREQRNRIPMIGDGEELCGARNRLSGVACDRPKGHEQLEGVEDARLHTALVDGMIVAWAPVEITIDLKSFSIVDPEPS